MVLVGVCGSENLSSVMVFGVKKKSATDKVRSDAQTP